MSGDWMERNQEEGQTQAAQWQRERREDLRHAYAREALGVLLSDRLQRTNGALHDTQKMALQALYIADRLLEVSDEFPEGTIKPQEI
jgi:ABC-type nitrate/sulfonate/bicarbonate transport system substrate-binding protein